MEDIGIARVVNLPIEDTGIPGHIQICTQCESNYHVRYMPSLVNHDQHMLVSLLDYRIVFDSTDVADDIKQQVIKFTTSNIKWILRYWYCGSAMNCNDILELFEEITPV